MKFICLLSGWQKIKRLKPKPWYVMGFDSKTHTIEWKSVSSSSPNHIHYNMLIFKILRPNIRFNILLRAYIRMGIYSEKMCSIAKLHIQSHFIKLNFLTSSKLAFINFSLYFAFQSSLKCVSMVVR